MKESPSQGTSLAQLREQYRSVRDGYNSLEILETHAVTQGLLWTTDNADSLWWVANHANHFYEGLPPYVRLLNLTADRLGKDAAFRLLPRLCFLALQTDAPTAIMSHLIDKICLEPSVASVCAYTSREFCEWAGVDVLLVSKSLRERAGTLSDSEGRPLGLKDHPYLRLFDGYFDDFESISSVDDRLDLMMGVRGGTTYQMFAPMFTVFKDGRILSPPKRPYCQEELELWIQITLDTCEGLSVLEKND
jgi:hypothetical protein